MNKSHTVTGIRGRRYRLTGKLGGGGEGIVFASEDPQLAVKLLHDQSCWARNRLKDSLAMVGRLPLEGMAIARPIEQLRPPHVGYVMELFTGMTPIRSLIHPPRKETGNVKNWYLRGGGLRRRLRILARVAEILCELHGRGLVYSDLSPNNIFVSQSANACEVRLIDSDNVHPATLEGKAIYTPGYGAPEVIHGIGTSSSLGDAWTFAVIAFEVLTLKHPSPGDRARVGKPALEELAPDHRVPWIDADDDQSRSKHGSSLEWVLSQRLRENFEQAFEPGRSDPSARPGLACWAERLHTAADRTLTCPKCSGSYYYLSNTHECSWCEAPRPSFVMAILYLWDPDRQISADSGHLITEPGLTLSEPGKHKVLHLLVISLNESVDLTERIAYGVSGKNSAVRVKYSSDRIQLKVVNNGNWCLRHSAGREKFLVKNEQVSLSTKDSLKDWELHCGPDDQLHRVIRFALRRGKNQ